MKTLLRVCIIIFNLIFIISHMSIFKQESELEIAVKVDVNIAIVTIIKTDRGIIKSTKKGKKIMLNQNKQIIKENEEKKRSIACLVIGIVFLILCVSSFSKILYRQVVETILPNFKYLKCIGKEILYLCISLADSMISIGIYGVIEWIHSQKVGHGIDVTDMKREYKFIYYCIYCGIALERTVVYGINKALKVSKQNLFLEYINKLVIGISECYGDIIAQLQVLDINNLQMATLILKPLGVIVGQPYKTYIDVFCYIIDIWKYIKKRKTR
jgi:hypothetical protein